MDWRLQGQEKYLQGVSLRRSAYEPASSSNDHDHCEFCSVKFMVQPGPGVVTEGYCTEDRYRWICQRCFDDFKNRFEWSIPSLPTCVRQLPPESLV